MVYSSRFLFSLLWLIAFFHVLVLAEHIKEPTNNSCKSLLERREWYHLPPDCPLNVLIICDRRKLTDLEKANYIKAIKCLQSRPPLHQHIAAVKTRFDEFQALHIDVADRVHSTV